MPPRARGRGGGRSRGNREYYRRRDMGDGRDGAGPDFRPRFSGVGRGFEGDSSVHGGHRGGDRGLRGGERDRGRGSLAGRYVEAPVFRPDPAPAIAAPGPKIAPGVVTVGVRRPEALGTLGKPLTVTTNCFKVTIPEATIYHYDVIKSDKEMPVKWNHELIRHLQERVAPNIFTPRAVYDGRKNLFASRRLPLRGRNRDSQVFDVTLGPAREGRTPRVHKVELKQVAGINPFSLKRYQQGQQSIDNMVLTVVTAVRVIVRMDSVSRYPFNTRSFFTDKEVCPVGCGIELWRGYFQSIRPGLHSLLINIDISTGMMFAPGQMIPICQQILKNNSPTALVPGQGLSDRGRISVQRFLTNVRFVTTHKDKTGRVSDKPEVIKKISAQSANNHIFNGPDGKQTSVAQYFRSIGVNLQYPNYVCVESSTGAAFPIEVCSILPGQLVRKQVPPDAVQAVLEFSTKKPDKRLNSIVAGHQALQYGQSEYVRQFEMTVSQQPEKCAAHVLATPSLDCGTQSKFKQIRPANGSWNWINRKFYEPADVGGAWAVVVYDGRGVRQQEAEEIVRGLKTRADALGIRGINADPPILFPPAHAMDVPQHLQAAGQQVFQKTKKAPTLFIIVLPDNSQDLYQAIKHFGDVSRGVATQCVRGFKSKRGNSQYWESVCLKINVKLGGVNSILDPAALEFVSDPANPIMIMGADVMCPAPGSRSRPSFASLVGSIDSNAVRYTAVSTAQGPRVNIIADIEDMVYQILSRHSWWKQNYEKRKNNFPKRIVYYRDGVSEGQFPHILDRELPAIKAACKRHNINPTITMVVVSKRHHVRFFPTHGMADKSGNCPAGTVVDDVVGHPTEFDFYLQSQSGGIGTSRPTHYNVLYDENKFTVGRIQSLSYALCHVYARSTRTVSIPAPVYYADIVCERAKNHYDTSIGYNSIDETEIFTSDDAIQCYKDLWKPVHENMRYRMYFQ